LPSEPESVLVTGASGLCGSHVADRLGAQPDRFDVSTLARRPLKRAHYVRHDLREPIPEGVLPARLNAIVHCAAAVDERDGGYGVVDDNVRAAFNLLALARDRGVKTIVNLSSIAVYGSTDGTTPITEDLPLRPATAYGTAKLLTETLFSSAGPDISVSHLRLAYVLAPKMPERYFIVRVASRLAAGEAVDIVNADTTRLSFIEVADVARACQMALESKAEGAFNLAADERPTPREVIDAIASHYPVSASPRRDLERADERFSPQFDTTRAKTLLGVDSIGDPLGAIRRASL